MTTKHEIEIPDLPDGWRVVAYRIPRKDENYLGVDGLVEKCSSPIYVHRIIVEKIQPRRIVFEATNECRQAVKGDWVQFCDCTDNCTDNFQRWNDLEPSTSKYNIWREIKEE